MIQNDSAVSGGGIATANGAVTVTDSTIEDNVATGSGGGIWTYGGTVTVTGSTLSANSAPGGGGISTTEGAVTVINSTIEDNVTTTAGGGGINSDGSTVTVTGTAIEDNTATAAGGGGGIYNAGTMTVSDSTIAGNTAAAYGGGIFNWYGLLTVTDCTIENNSVSTYPDGGGGIINLDGALTVSSSTISGNSTGQYGPGGGIANGGTLTISNSTIASNSAGYDAFGGGIVNGFYDAGTLTAVNSTIAYNDAYNSGGGLSDTPGSTATLYNTIIAANTGGDGADDIAGAGVSSASAYNLVGVDETGSLTNGTDGNQVGVTSPGLASGPANNGGSTQTIAFMPGSPAIDTGRNGINGFTLFTDQRGYVPPAGVWDIGAYQLNAIPPSAPTATLSAANVTPAGYGQTAYTFSITFASNAAIEASTLAGAVVAVVPACRRRRPDHRDRRQHGGQRHDRSVRQRPVVYRHLRDHAAGRLVVSGRQRHLFGNPGGLARHRRRSDRDRHRERRVLRGARRLDHDVAHRLSQPFGVRPVRHLHGHRHPEHFGVGHAGRHDSVRDRRQQLRQPRDAGERHCHERADQHSLGRQPHDSSPLQWQQHFPRQHRHADPGGQQGQHHDQRRSLDEHIELWPSRDLHDQSHGQPARLGDSLGNG